MDGNPHREFFARPTHPHHRRYEALRAVFLDGRPQKEVAERFAQPMAHWYEVLSGVHVTFGAVAARRKSLKIHNCERMTSSFRSKERAGS